MNHNIAVRAFIDDERKAQVFEVAPHMATDAVLIKSENANAMQSWISKNEDFFFCHRVAKDEPHSIQKHHPAPLDISYTFTWSSPEAHLKFSELNSA